VLAVGLSSSQASLSRFLDTLFERPLDCLKPAESTDLPELRCQGPRASTGWFLPVFPAGWGSSPRSGPISTPPMFHSTTILSVRHLDRAVMAGDGQVTLGDAVVKKSARKIRRLYGDTILAGFAGSAADSFALYSRFESKLEQYRGNLERSAVELARDWRTDRVLRRLEAMLIVLDRKSTFLLSGTGDLIEPDDGIVAIGSGGGYALAAARALARASTLDARAIAETAMAIAADVCIYTNSNIIIEEL